MTSSPLRHPRRPLPQLARFVSTLGDFSHLDRCFYIMNDHLLLPLSLLRVASRWSQLSTVCALEAQSREWL
jgi:hypothetical protein